MQFRVHKKTFQSCGESKKSRKTRFANKCETIPSSVFSISMQGFPMVRKHSPRRCRWRALRAVSAPPARIFAFCVFGPFARSRFKVALQKNPRKSSCLSCSAILSHVSSMLSICCFDCRKSLLFVFLALNGSRPSSLHPECGTCFFSNLYGVCLTKTHVGGKQIRMFLQKKKVSLVVNFHCRLT